MTEVLFIFLKHNQVLNIARQCLGSISRQKKKETTSCTLAVRAKRTSCTATVRAII